MLAVTIQVKTVTLNSAVFSKAYIMAAGRPDVNCNYMYNKNAFITIKIIKLLQQLKMSLL